MSNDVDDLGREIDPVNRRTTLRDRVYSWVRIGRDGLPLWIIIAAVGVAVWYFNVDIPNVPDWLRKTLIAVAILGPPVYAVGGRIARWLRPLVFEQVFEVDAAEDKINGWYVPPAIWDDKEVLDGTPYQTPDGSWVVRDFEWNDGRVYVRGNWKGELNDVELMTFERAVEANRGQLRKWARIGQSLYSQLPSVVQAIESAYWRALSDKTLDALSTEPDVVRSEVTEDVERLTESVETPEPPDYGDLDPDEDIDQQITDENLEDND